VGARLVVGGDGTFTKRTVVGVAASVLYAGPASGDEQHVYLPYRQFAPGAVDLMIRVQRMNAEIVSSLRSAVHQAAPGASIRRFEAVDAAMARYFVEPGFYAWLLTAFAAIALLLAVGGLYGTLSFAVSRRRREFGIRLALGAAGSELERLVVARGLFITALGLVLGVVGSVAASRVLGGYLFQVSGTDAPTYGAVCLAFLTVAALASWMPARKAGSTEPVESLRVS
jgi:predicted lysophospholipase L1 biosynthesis ABC-type transport system permease subunit